jgi:hypothetical protein
MSLRKLGDYIPFDLVNSVDRRLDRFRVDLFVDQEQVRREEGYKDSERVQWLLNNIYLTEGGLDDLGLVYENVRGRKAGGAYFARFKGNIPARTSVSVESSNLEIVRFILEKRLKLNLHERNCNAGVRYRVYEKGGLVIAEAVPANISI